MVLEAAVFGIPDERWGEKVHAVVVPHGPVTAEEIIFHCRGRIAAYKGPHSVELREEPLPKSGPGKVLKRELRASLLARTLRADRLSGSATLIPATCSCRRPPRSRRERCRCPIGIAGSRHASLAE